MTTIDLWHPINGMWVHIAQTTEDGKHKYYTDGVKEIIPSKSADNPTANNTPHKET